MSPRRRRLLRGLALVFSAFLLSCAATSYAYVVLFSLKFSQKHYAEVWLFSLNRGAVAVSQTPGGPPPWPTVQTMWIAQGDRGYLWKPHLSLRARSFFTGKPKGWRFELVIPFWMLIIGCVASTGLTFRITRRTPGANECGRCAYDLTGNTSGVCPECGTPISVNDANSAAPRSEEPPK